MSGKIIDFKTREVIAGPARHRFEPAEREVVVRGRQATSLVIDSMRLLLDKVDGFTPQQRGRFTRIKERMKLIDAALVATLNEMED